MIKLKDHSEKIDELLDQWKDEEYVNAFFSKKMIDKASGPPSVEDKVKGLTIERMEIESDIVSIHLGDNSVLTIGFAEYEGKKGGRMVTSLFKI